MDFAGQHSRHCRFLRSDSGDLVSIASGDYNDSHELLPEHFRKAIMTALIELGDPTDGVLVATMNDPKTHNAISADMRASLVEMLATATNLPGVSAVVLKGAGGTFSSGGDIRTMGSQDPAALDERMRSVTETAL